MGARRRALRLSGLLVALGTFCTAAPSRAAEPSKAECITANETGQRLRREGKLAEARAALQLSMSASCPGAIRQDSARLLGEIEAALSRKQEEQDAARQKEQAEKARQEAERQKAGHPRADAKAAPVSPAELERAMRAGSDQAGCGYARQAGTLAAWRLYRQVFPDGACRDEAARRVAELEAASRPDTPAPAAPSPRPGPANGGPDAPEHSPSGLRVAGYVTLGLGAAALAGFAVTGGLAASQASTLHDQCPQDRCPAELSGDLDASRGLANVATVLLVAGSFGAAAGVTLVILSSGGGSEPAASARLGLAPLGAALRGSF